MLIYYYNVIMEVFFMASVTLEHLSKIYSNGFVSVNDVSLRVDNGEFITLHGPADAENLRSSA